VGDGHWEFRYRILGVEINEKYKYQDMSIVGRRKK